MIFKINERTGNDIEPKIKNAVLSIDEAADVLLFGSRARGDFGEDSDWDILILTNEKVNDALRLNYIGAILPLEIKHAAAINLVVKNRVMWRQQVHTDLFINIYEDGIAL